MSKQRRVRLLLNPKTNPQREQDERFARTYQNPPPELFPQLSPSASPPLPEVERPQRRRTHKHRKENKKRYQMAKTAKGPLDAQP
jgi:hypothetical protein